MAIYLSPEEVAAHQARVIAGRKGKRVDLVPVSPKAKSKRGANKWETEYAATQLEPRKLVGEIIDYRFEAIRLRLASGAWFKVDYFVVPPDKTLEAHEVKGHWREAARVRIKVAAELYPFIKFIIARKMPKKQGGGWKIEEL